MLNIINSESVVYSVSAAVECINDAQKELNAAGVAEITRLTFARLEQLKNALEDMKMDERCVKLNLAIGRQNTVESRKADRQVKLAAAIKAAKLRVEKLESLQK